ncbi:hypothetical protein LTR47_004480 [Exophiala xenobiotica]|nr:hypothetical protein LTR47_004480 [Exophiala xenobiotica]KAK5244890.1 hypothetical protein LTS06_009622 [Exophiala xenobiotica]KAK5257787.1 hypothetical protein LTR40_009197 [Exophiala xenobiotica]KAK5352192.1 hypothetical protein LTR61_004443 [Exophiala xenobiotica]KAK5369052.1 hypothetical protein LTR11_007423 [Exophiala xenobiotica]
MTLWPYLSLLPTASPVPRPSRVNDCLPLPNYKYKKADKDIYLLSNATFHNNNNNIQTRPQVKSTMAQTRGATGNAKPRVFAPVSTEPVRKRKTTGTTTKKSAVGGAGVTKKRAPATHKSKSTLKDKVEGAVDKVVGTVEGKPGKKAAGTRKMKGARTAKVKAV